MFKGYEEDLSEFPPIVMFVVHRKRGVMLPVRLLKKLLALGWILTYRRRSGNRVKWSCGILVLA